MIITKLLVGFEIGFHDCKDESKYSKLKFVKIPVPPVKLKLAQPNALLQVTLVVETNEIVIGNAGNTVYVLVGNAQPTASVPDKV